MAKNNKLYPDTQTIRNNEVFETQSERLKSSKKLIEQIKEMSETFKKKNLTNEKNIKSNTILFGYLSAFNTVFFDTEEELINYIVSGNPCFGNICIVEYLGEFQDEKDVIKIFYRGKNTVICTILNEDGYAVYNPIKSIEKNSPVWEYSRGRLLDIYTEFNNRGITFENDTYKKILNQKQKTIQLPKKN